MPQDTLEEVQSKLAYLERAIVEIGDVVYRQHGEIQVLQAKIGALADRLEVATSAEVGSADPQLPPHY